MAKGFRNAASSAAPLPLSVVDDGDGFPAQDSGGQSRVFYVIHAATCPNFPASAVLSVNPSESVLETQSGVSRLSRVSYVWSEVGVYLNSMYCRRRARGRQKYLRSRSWAIRTGRGGRVLFLERSSHAPAHLLVLR